jgi:hypothetical protein
MKRLINYIGLLIELSSDKRKTEHVFTITDEILDLSNNIHPGPCQPQEGTAVHPMYEEGFMPHFETSQKGQV